MPIDMRAWLTEMGIPADKHDALLPTLSESAVAANIEKSVLRQSDYSRNMNDLTAKQTALTTAQTKLDEANERLNLEMVEWSQTQADGGQVTEKMRRDLAKAQGEVTRLTSIVTSKATELGIDPKTIIDEPVVTPPTNTAPTVDLSGYVKADDLQQTIGRVSQYLMTLPADVARLQHEHQQLTGEWLDPKAIIDEVQRRAGDKLNRNPDGTFKKSLDARAIWEETHDIGTKRAAKQEADRQAEIKAAEDRGYERRATEQAIPGQQPVGRHSPVLLQAGNAQTGGSKATRPGSPAAAQSRLSTAASALATHKYRGSGSGQPAGR